MSYISEIALAIKTEQFILYVESRLDLALKKKRK